MLQDKERILRVLMWALSRSYPYKYKEQWHSRMRELKTSKSKINAKDVWSTDIFAMACGELRMSSEEIYQMRLALWNNPYEETS